MRHVQSGERKVAEIKKLNTYIKNIYYLKDIEKDVYNIGKTLTVKTKTMVQRLVNVGKALVYRKANNKNWQ